MIDTHAHIDQIENIEIAMNEAWDAGLSSIIAVGVHGLSNQKNLELQKQFHNPKIYVALGVHPEFANQKQAEEAVHFIRENVNQAIAIGEIGLDYWYRWARKKDEVKEKLRYIFRLQLKIAKESGLPVLIHSRGAWDDCFDIVNQLSIEKANFHWYSGPVDILKKILEKGFYISCTPSLAYSKEAREAIQHTPIEQTLIETDTPVVYRCDNGQGKFRAAPKDVLHTLKIYCKLKKIDREKAKEILNNNARKFFEIE